MLASAVIDDGGNLESATDCAFSGGHQSTDPLLAAALDTSQPPTLALGATSPAIDIAACGTRFEDQRGVPRPQGTTCDAGAYERDPVAPDTTIATGPVGPTNETTPTFTFTSTEVGSTFQCRVDAAAFAACISPFTTAVLSFGAHTFEVRAIDLAGNVDATPASRNFTVVFPQPTTTPQPTPNPTPSATPAPTPVPTFHQSVVVAPGGGTILVRIKGATKFAPLDVTKGIPLGSEVDARKGKVVLTSVPKAGGVPETATFFDGLFIVNQIRDVTELRLSEKLTGCKKSKKKASAAAKKPKTRKLWGDGKGKFRTRGQYSAATIRGTKWLVQDTCTTTLTRVAQGVVSVSDFAKKKTVLVKKGKRYTARAKR